jgi:hypothetical protein
MTVLEGQFNGGRRERLNDLLARQKLTADLLHHARAIKRATEQIRVVGCHGPMLHFPLPCYILGVN